MADLGISETQFAFAWFHKYMNQHRGAHFSFSFPTVKQEGSRTRLGGYDLRIKGNYFIQFKMSEIFFQPSNPAYYTKEIRDKNLGLSDYPYFRFKVYNSQRTQQLNNLVRLAAISGNIVEYVAPTFIDEKEFLTKFNSSKENIGVSLRINSRTLNGITAGQNHVICYHDDMIKKGFARMFSDPIDIGCVFSNKSISQVSERFSSGQFDFNIEGQLNLFNEMFNGLNISMEDNLDTIQMKLLANSGIYWIPLIETK